MKSLLRTRPLLLLTTAGLLAAFAPRAHAQKALQRLQRSAAVFHEIMAAPDGGIPDIILKHAQCIMIVPGYKKAGFGFGGELGRGVVTCRVSATKSAAAGWSAPLFVSLGGVSFGLQIGAQESDVVMLIMNRDGEQHLLHDKVSLGGDMAATAGPVGRDANAWRCWTNSACPGFAATNRWPTTRTRFSLPSIATCARTPMRWNLSRNASR